MKGLMTVTSVTMILLFIDANFPVLGANFPTTSNAGKFAPSNVLYHMFCIILYHM